MFASVPVIPKFAPWRAAMYGELRNRDTSGLAAIFRANLTRRANSYNFVRAADDTVCPNLGAEHFVHKPTPITLTNQRSSL